MSYVTIITLSPNQTLDNLKVLEMEPVRFSKGDLYMSFIRPFQLKRSHLIKLTFFEGGKVL